MLGGMVLCVPLGDNGKIPKNFTRGWYSGAGVLYPNMWGGVAGVHFPRFLFHSQGASLETLAG